MANTIDTFGDLETLEALISGQLTDYTDDAITEFDSKFNFNYTGLISLNLPELVLVKSGYLSNNNYGTITSLQVPKLKYAYGSWPGYMNTLTQIVFPELRVFTYGMGDIGWNSNSNIMIANYPKLVYTTSRLRIPYQVSIYNFDSLEYIKSYIEIPSINIFNLRFPKLKYLMGTRITSNGEVPQSVSGGSNLILLDLASEDLRYINISKLGDRTGLLNLIIRSTRVPELRNTEPIRTDSGINPVKIYVPFFMLAKYRSDTKWNHVNYAPYINSLETLSSESNHSITPDELVIPYYQDTIGYTCSLLGSYIDNSDNSSHESETLSYHITENIGINKTTSQVTKSVTETYGSQNLSFQLTQSGIDFNSGYSISNLRTYGWNEFSDEEFPDNFRYFKLARARYHNGVLENGINVNRSDDLLERELVLLSNDITIFINGLTYFDFYMTCYITNQNYQWSTSSSYQECARTGRIYIGNLDSEDPKSDYLRKLQDSTYNLSSSDYADNTLQYYYQSGSTNSVSIDEIKSDITKWKHIEFNNIDPSVPHIIKIKAEVSNNISLNNKFYGYHIAIPDSYTYNAIPTLNESID